MKHIIFSLSLAGFSLCASCQVNQRDSINNAVNLYVQSVNRAADTFLSRNFPVEVRLKSIAPYAIIYDQRQIQQFKRVLMSRDEPPIVRAMALNKIYQPVENDDTLFNQVLTWFADPQTPKELRNETLNFIGNVAYSSMAGATEVYQKMVQDPDIKFRAFAISKLVLRGDQRTQQLLISGLQNPQAALLEPSLAIETLALSPKPEFYPAVYKVLEESADENSRLAALQTLGPYREARQRIVAISQDAKEKEELRVSALMALYAGDKENIVQYVRPILLDANAPPRLQALGIQMTTDLRKSMAYRKSRKARSADDYDKLLLSIREGRTGNYSDEVKAAANTYLLLVRPNF